MKKIEELNTFEDFGEYVTLKRLLSNEYNNEFSDIQKIDEYMSRDLFEYLDPITKFNHEKKKINDISLKFMDNQLKPLTNIIELSDFTIKLKQTSNIYSQHVILNKINDVNEIRKDFTKNVIELASKNSKSYMFDNVNTTPISKIIYELDIDMIKNTLIGPSQIFILSEKNYIKFLKFDYNHFSDDLWLPSILIDDSIDDIIVYRNNSINLPSLILYYNDFNYGFIQQGLKLENQFYKIILPKE